MIISLIAAMDNNRVIGKKNSLPWYLPADLRHFKKLTMGKAIIMGSTTFASIGKALPDRVNIVMTRDHNFAACLPVGMVERCIIVHSVEDALTAAQGYDEIMVIGGAQIFAQFLPRANKMYLTMIDAQVDGDVYFPEWNQNEWHETSRETHEPDQKNNYSYIFLTLERT